MGKRKVSLASLLAASLFSHSSHFILHYDDDDRLRVPLPPPASPLSTLKDTLYNMTGVAPSYMKLIHSGAVMKDDLTSLAAYGLVDLTPPPSDPSSSAPTPSPSFWDSWSFGGGSNKKQKLVKIVMLGSKETEGRVTEDRLGGRRIPIAEPIVEKEPEIESNVVAEILALSGDKLDALEPQIKELEDYLAAPPASTPTSTTTTSSAPPSAPSTDAPSPSSAAATAAPPPTTINARTPIFLSEILIQSLLKLDSFQISSDWTEARKARKEAVRKVQLLLDRVDSVKERMKARL